MNSKFGIQQVLVSILLVTMFAAASLLEFGSTTVPIDPVVLKLRYLLVFLSLIGIFLLALKDKRNWHEWKFNRQLNPFLGIWIAFCGMVEISGCINQDLISIRDGYWLMIGVPLFFFYAIPRLLKGTGNAVIPSALVISHMPFLLGSLIFNPPFTADQIFYSGILGNSNQLGFVSTVTAAGILILLWGGFCAKKPFFLLCFLVSLLIITIGVLFFAFARTSIISLVVMILVCATIFFLRQPKSLIKIAFVSSFVISILLFQLDRISQYISYGLGIDIFSLFQKKEAGLSGREEIWLRTIKEATILGHGSSYYDSFEHGPHNTIIKMLGVYGAISMYITIFLAIASIIYARAYFKAHFSTNFYAMTPLIITICFWMLSIGEDMFGSLGKGITLAYFATMGVMMTEFSPKESSQSSRQLSTIPEK